MSQGTPLSVLNLTIRAQYCLKRGRVYDVETLRAMEARDILSIPEVGKKTLQEINLALAEYESTTKPEGVGMNLREAAEMALEALKEVNKLSVGEIAVCLPAEIDDAMEALHQALAQPVDAVNISAERVDETEKCNHVWTYAGSKRQQAWQCLNCQFWRFSEPVAKRDNLSWVGLTDDERKQIVSYIRDPIDWVPAVEAKLKEKNHD